MAGVCKLCGAPYNDGAKFCTECGAALISRMGENDAASTPTVTTVTAGVEKVETTTETTVSTENVTEEARKEPVANTYGAANTENPSAYHPYHTDTNVGNPYGGANYNAPNGSNPYGGANYNAPNGSNPYGGANYNAPNGSNPYGGANYNAPNGSNPYSGANYNAPNGSNPYGGANYNAPNGSNPYGGAPGGNPYINNQMKPTRPVNIGMLVFSIINLIIGFCTCTGFIFGGAGLAFTLMAKSAQRDEDAKRNDRVALVLNIVGVVISILMIVAWVALMVSEGFAAEPTMY